MNSKIGRETKESQRASSIKYLVRLEDTAMNRGCNVYLSTDWDLELLLLFLRSITGLEHDIKDVKKESLDP